MVSPIDGDDALAAWLDDKRHETYVLGPGFGDFGLEYQPFIFEALDCPRNLGLTLTDSFLMSPTKSVTALIGILDEENA